MSLEGLRMANDRCFGKGRFNFPDCECHTIYEELLRTESRIRSAYRDVCSMPTEVVHEQERRPQLLDDPPMPNGAGNTERDSFKILSEVTNGE